MKYEDLSESHKLGMLKSLKTVSDIKYSVGHCLPNYLRVDPECFHCDDCWMNVLKKDLGINQ